MNPQEQTIPPTDLREFTIKISRTETKSWNVSCPKWKYEAPTGNLKKTIKDLLIEIEDHMEELEPATHKRLPSVPPNTYGPLMYRDIELWHKSSGSFYYYIRNLQKDAAEDGAPLDALYKRDGTWITVGDLDPYHRYHHLRRTTLK